MVRVRVERSVARHTTVARRSPSSSNRVAGPTSADQSARSKTRCAADHLDLVGRRSYASAPVLDDEPGQRGIGRARDAAVGTCGAQPTVDAGPEEPLDAPLAREIQQRHEGVMLPAGAQ